MATRSEKDRLRNGSMVSLQGAEYIPKEYHRRILKKIAQLTKVIYNLNTKIDENENFIESLRAVHETENRRVLEDSAAQLKRCEELFSREKESSVVQVEKLSQALENMREERDQLFDKQVTYRTEAEEHLSHLKTEHTTKVQSLVTELKKFRSEQEKQVKQISNLRARITRQSSDEIKAVRLQHEEDMAKIKDNSESQIKTLENELASLKSAHSAEIDAVTKRFQSQLNAQSETLANAQKDLLSQERQAWEEKERQLSATLLEKEEHLKHQISILSKHLTESNDKLALSEQKVRDLEAHCEESKSGSGTLRALLEKCEADNQCLRDTVNTLQADLEIAKEKYKQQTVEMQTTSGTIAKLEAASVSNDGIIISLRSELASVQDRLKLVLEEREGLESSQLNLEKNQTARIAVLEKEIGKVRTEKHELHAQFAREIEAAHAQLSHREAELEQDHLITLKNIKEQHAQALAGVKEENRLSLDAIRKQLVSAKDLELQQLNELYTSKVSKLQVELTNKTLELDQALEQLKSLDKKLSREKQGLGSATSTIDELKAGLVQCQSSLLASQQQFADATTENAQLKLTVESLQTQKVESEKVHCEKLKICKTDLTTQLEAVWMERIKRETTSLRSELTHRHSEEQRVALTELAGLKDSALKQAQEKWEEEKRKLLTQIASMERELKHLQQKASISLEEAKTSSDSQINSLKKDLLNEIQKHKEALAYAQKSHLEEVGSIQTKNQQDKDALSKQLRDRHNQELLSLQRANQLAVDALREKLESEAKQRLTLVREDNKEKMRLLEEKLGQEFKDNITHVQTEHLTEIEKFRQEIGNTVTRSQEQICTQEEIAEALRRELKGRDSELSALREKGNSLTVVFADLKKALTMREQELQLAKREAKSTLKIREQQLITIHHTELEAINAQHRHKAQQLFTDFNKAKSLLSSKIHELEKELSEWEQRYKLRESKPEDLEAIRELKMIVREQEQKMKDLVAEKRVYQLELMNREKNYNKLFNVNPQVGVLNPLQQKQQHQKKSRATVECPKYASAPSLLDPLSPEPPHQLPPLPNSLRLSALPSDSTLLRSSSSSPPSKRTSQLDTKPQKLVVLQDSPLRQKKGIKKAADSSQKSLNGHSGSLSQVDTQSQTSIRTQKQTMTVQ